MLEWLTYRRKLGDQRKRLRIEKRWMEARAARGGTVSADEVPVLDDHLRRTRTAEVAIEGIETAYLLSRAKKYEVEVPRDESTFLVGSPERLTEKGFISVRAAIRKAKNERWQSAEMRLKVTSMVIASITGIVGALIGLVAMLKK
jgi:hypothetical protein